MNRSGRAAGLAVFGLGIIVLFFVFGTAYGMFTSPASALFIAEGNAGPSLSAAGLGRAVIWILVRIALLFVMALAGSVMASRGIELYLGSSESFGADGTQAEPPPSMEPSAGN